MSKIFIMLMAKIHLTNYGLWDCQNCLPGETSQYLCLVERHSRGREKDWIWYFRASSLRFGKAGYIAVRSPLCPQPWSKMISLAVSKIPLHWNTPGGPDTELVADRSWTLTLYKNYVRVNVIGKGPVHAVGVQSTSVPPSSLVQSGRLHCVWHCPLPRCVILKLYPPHL